MIGLRPLRENDGWGWCRTVDNHGWCLEMLPRSVQNRQPFQDNVTTLTKVANLETSKLVCIPQKKESRTKICSPCTKNNMHQLKSQPFPRKTVSGFPPKGSTDFLENLEGDPPKSSTFQHIFRQSSWTPWHLRDPSFISSSPLEKSRGNPWSTFWIPMGYKRRRLTSFLAKNVFENWWIPECFGQPSPSTKALCFSNRIPNYPSHNKNIIFHWWNNQDTKTSWKKSGYKNQWECGNLQECMQLNIPC